MISVVEEKKRESGITPGLWITYAQTGDQHALREGDTANAGRTLGQEMGPGIKKELAKWRKLTVLAPCKPVEFLTASLIVCMYDTASAEYSYGASSKKMPCIARLLFFVAQPAYVATSEVTREMF